jgi:surfactin synthase thioesterase subunit
VPLALMSLFRPSVQPYLISWFRYDPAAEIAKLNVPVLIVQGDRDVQVNAAEAQRLAEHATDGRLVIIEGMNHVFKASAMDGDAQRKTYMDGSLPMVGKLPQTIGDFIQSTDEVK